MDTETLVTEINGLIDDLYVQDVPTDEMMACLEQIESKVSDLMDSLERE